MKKLMILFLLILICDISNATLTVNNVPRTKTGGTNPALQDSDISDVSGNVGIGSPNPIQKLDVIGTAKATAFIGNGALLTSVNAVSGSNTQVQFNDSGVQAGDSGLIFDKTTGILTATHLAGEGSAITGITGSGGSLWTIGNVGINTTNNVGISSVAPGQKLDVQGTVRATSFLGDGSQLTGISGSISGLTATKIPVASSSTSIINSNITQDSGGNIGINTTIPISTLGVRESNIFDLVYNFNGVSTYTDVTTESKTTFGTVFGAMADNTQFFYLGKSTTFQNVSVTLKTFTTGAGTIVAEYWNGSAWTAISITDSTSGFQNNGTLLFTLPGDWAQVAVNSQTYYWLRLHFSATPSTVPGVYSIRPAANQEMSIYSGFSDTVPILQVTRDGKVLQNGTSITTPVTYTVGLATSRNGHGADYVCTGAKDQVCIQKAITACGGNPCKIVLLEGTYNLTGSINWTQNNLWLDGMGPGKTILKISNTPVPILSDSTATGPSPRIGSIVTNIEFDRSSDTKDGTITRKCISLPFSKRAIVDHVYVHDGGATCIATDYSQGTIVTNNRVENCGTTSATTGNSGLGMGTGEYTTEPLIMSNNVITGTGFAGVLIEAQTGGSVGQSNNYIVANNIITNGAQYGIMIRGAGNVNITGNVIRQNTKNGIQVMKWDTDKVPNNISIVGNQINDNTLYGVSVSDTTKIQVKDNDLSGNGSGPILYALTDPTELTRFGNISDTINYVPANVGIGSYNPGQVLDIFGGRARMVGIGTTVPQAVCMKADGTLGYYTTASFAGVCN